MVSMRRKINLPMWIGLAFALALAGCGSVMTRKDQFKSINDNFSRRDFSAALAQIEKSKGEYYEEKDRVMYYLDAGLLSHYAGLYDKSNGYLSKAETGIEELFTASVSKAGASLLLNDNVLDYSGEDYEDIYLNVFKALNYIHLDKWDDAIVEIKRINNKLSLLEDKYKKLAEEYNKGKDATIKMRTGTNNFYNSALGRYISLLIYRGEGAQDSARIDRDKIKEAFSREANLYPFAPPDLTAALAQTANARVNFICFTGRNPQKSAFTLRLHSENNLLVIVPSAENSQFEEEFKGFAAVPWPGLSGDYYFKFQLPRMVTPGSAAEKVRIRLSGAKETVIQGQRIESLERIAKFTFDVKKPLIYLKTILRTVGKGLVAAEAKKGIHRETKNALLGDLLSLATDATVDLSENADLRIARFFPAQAIIAETALPSGKYKVVIEYLNHDGGVLFSDDRGDMEIKKAELTLVESFFLE
jgi:hypothetical protein